MSLKYGNGISRTLDAKSRQFKNIVFQIDRPPLDSELVLQDDLHDEALRKSIQALMPSGFLLDPTRAINDYQFDPFWTNLFALGNPKDDEKQAPVWANVNGWFIPVAGTDVSVEGDLRNFIKLYPPPETDDRVDLVFLEVWQTMVSPNPSTVNKPTASTIWKYGNTKYGAANFADDLEDPAIGVETTERVQVQYRIRVFGAGVGLGSGSAIDVYPDGLGDPNVLGQGTAAAPIGGLIFANMRAELGDPGLWRAGNGDPTNALGTVDGFTYAIPICAITRRNTNPYVAIIQGNPNQNGAFDRNPGAGLLPNPLGASRILKKAQLSGYLSPTTVNVPVALTDLDGSGLEDGALVLGSTFLVIDKEIVGISAVNVNAGTVTISSRGRWGTAPTGHQAGAGVNFFNTRPDGLFADQIAAGDVLDLRKGVNPGDWDYQRLLAHNVVALAKGELKTAWKKSATGDTEGVTVHEVDYLFADGQVAPPNQTAPLDGPDGIRMVWSDGAAIQPDVTILLDNEATADNSNGIGLTTADQFDTTTVWEVGPDFHPVGFLNDGPVLTNSFTNGSSLMFFIGGDDGTKGARGTFRDGGTKAVRFVTPKEYWKAGYPLVAADNGNQNPVTLRFLKARAEEAAPVDSPHPERHPGPMYPVRELDFERPFIVLGGLLHSTLKVTNIAANKLSNAGGVRYLDIGLPFDQAGVFYSLDTFTGDIENDPSVLQKPLLRAQRTLFGMLTNDGQDRTGASSEVYIVLYGDKNSTNNNGCFKVIGAGTVGYTIHDGLNATSLVLQPLSADFTAFDTGDGSINIRAEFRSQYHNSEDTSDYAARTADFCIVLTDIGGIDKHPWNKDTLGQGTGNYDVSFYPVNGQTNKVAVAQKLLVSATLMYHPGRGGMARVPEVLTRLALNGGNSTYLQQAKSVLDTTFSANTGTPVGERFFAPVHAQTWNRLPGLGWNAPDAKNYGGNVVGFTEQDRENQAFYDKGSKTLIFRPFRDRALTLQATTFAELGNAEGLLGGYAYPDNTAKDGLQILTNAHNTNNALNGQQMGFAVPREFMPRFGRQDIPYFKDTQSGQGTFLEGINHLFTDKVDATNPVFNVIGGPDNLSGGNQVKSMFFATGGVTAYGHSGTIINTINNRPHYGARKTSEIDDQVQYAKGILDRLKAVNSSDLGRGLKGIQLPPYLGIARLYGVYEIENYKAKGGRTVKANRWESENDPATNLLLQDAQAQTLFILQDGAKDLTRAADDHTYLIPSNAIDITRITGYVPGVSKFEDFNYVVEAVVFVFAKGWINKNNFVLCRRHNGQGTPLRKDGTDPELEGIPLVIPCPASSNDQVYTAYNRTPYQGDPYMTRNGENRTESDYTNRYGQVPMAGQLALRTVIQQYDSSGNFVPETPNARGFEVLAALDFYTTLGTGKVGGKMYPGTPLDVGYTENTPPAAKRMPVDSAVPPWRIVPRAFSEGQKTSLNRAQATVDMVRADVPDEWIGSTITFNLLDSTEIAMEFHLPSTYDQNNPEHVEVALILASPYGKIQDKYHAGFLTNALAIPAHGTNTVVLTNVLSVTTADVVAISVPTLPAGLTVAAAVTNSNPDEITITLNNVTNAQIVLGGNVAYTLAVFTENHSPEGTAKNLAERINLHSIIKKNLRATASGQRVFLESVAPGKEGNKLRVTLAGGPGEGGDPSNLMRLVVPHPNTHASAALITSTYFIGGEDIPVNGGDGTSQLALTGMTERLPLGSLLQDSDFLCENPLGDNASSMKVALAGLRPIQTLLPLTEGGDEYSRFMGSPGELLAMSDGFITTGSYAAWTDADNTGTKRFRLFRGGGSSFVLSGTSPGGPIDWVSDTFPASIRPLLKGGVLACRALLVRNFKEQAFAQHVKVSDGDEIQMVILTYGILGDGSTVKEGINLAGTISPSGYGEGYAAADRYRIEGHPLFKGYSRVIPGPDTTKLAVYPETERGK